MTTYLYCFRNGEAKFGKKIPHGAIEIAKQTDFEETVERDQINNFKNSPNADPADEPLSWRDKMEACLRRGYEPGVLLVPGIPEAETDKEAMDALVRFTKWCNRDG